MKKLEEMLEFNKKFVEDKEYDAYITSKEPNKKMVILSCMDTRLTELLPKALNLKNGDVKLIKNAGATISHPFGSAMRSILVAIYEFKADEVLIVGHHCCGMSSINPDKIIEKMNDRGIPKEIVSTLINAGIDIRKWLKGFDSVEESVNESVKIVKTHPLIPNDIKVHGAIMDPVTGKIDLIVNGYEV